jgi:hypothetical protein
MVFLRVARAWDGVARALGPAIAAPLVILYLAGAGGCTGSTPPAAQPTAAPEPLAPRGPVTSPFSFTWKPVPGLSSPVYRVRVTDAAERVLYEQDVRVTECRPSAELKAMMADHATFSWSVGVMSADNSAVVSRSAPVEFSLK